jgi:uncharacterized Ntn-hydrolase superfamily protein
MTVLKRLALSVAALVFAAPYAQATYSIVACDAQTRECGVAVQTNNLAVGSSVPYAKAGVGAIASQFETNPMYGSRGLALLAQGRSPDEVLNVLLHEDGNFDGEGIEARQVGIVSVSGRFAEYTGAEAAASPWAGSRTGNGYSIQGNGLAGPQVVEAMEKTFNSTPGALAERLMTALSAGDKAGGQKTGRESAALLVSTPSGFPMDIDLRVDHSSDPVAALRLLFDIQTARQQIIQARIDAGNGQLKEAKALLIAGVARAPMWPRTWVQAARVAGRIEEPDLAVQYLNILFAMNPAWIETEIGDGNYAQLGADPLFHRWVTAEQQHAALADFTELASSNSVTEERRIQIANRNLEVGAAHEALQALAVLPGEASGDADVLLARATAYAALGNYGEALNQCARGVENDPKFSRLRLRCARWRTASESKSDFK